MTDSSARLAPDRDPEVLFQRPPIFGFRYQLPPNLPTFQAPPEVVEELRQRREALRSMDARRATLAANTRTAESRKISPELAWGSVAAAVVSFFLIGAGGPVSNIGAILLVASFACVWYCWPYLVGGNYRKQLAQLLTDRATTVGRIAELEGWVAEREAAIDARQRHILATTPTWFGVTVPTGYARIELFGGDKIGWESMLTMMGASLLATGHQLLVLDFSERLVSTCLAQLAAHTGRKLTQVFLPEQSDHLDVFRGLDDETVIDTVVQAWQGGELERAARVDMNRDRYVLARIGDCLESPITLGRLAAGVDFVLHQSVSARKHAELSSQEQALLLDSFGTAVRGGMQFSDRLMPLSAYLKSLGMIGSGRSRFRLADAGKSDLAVIALTPSGHSLDKAALMEILVQALQRHFTRTTKKNQSRPSHLVIAGADLLSNAAIERLHRFAEDAGVALVLFYNRFDENVAKLAGSGNSAQLFMKLGNRGDAERAADHLGLRRYFVLASQSVNATETVTDTQGEALTRSDGTSLGMMAVNLGQMPLFIPNVTRTVGNATSTTWGKSTAKSAGTADTFSRVHERFVEPETIQGLPP
ncbi:MAG: hypothetical protein LC808_09470, partial [Actinobacteria bacterium]|nr:hypothetical protein [Actinomycetota bacterium]